MKNTNEKITNLNEAALEEVNGGNSGDFKNYDNGKVPKYKIGDWVEVYVDGIHWRTKRCQVLSHTSSGIMYKGLPRRVWYYTVSDFDKVITADDIER